jgi:hypothetical protein
MPSVPPRLLRFTRSKAANNCGTTSGTFTVTVQDQQAPTILAAGFLVTLNSNGSQRTASSTNSADQQLHAYPNPITDKATVSFRPTQAGKAQVKFYNQLGVLVATLYDGPVEASRLYSATLNGQPLVASVYNCQLITNGRSPTSACSSASKTRQ